MKIFCLIAEFNPFTFGHKYIIDKVKSEHTNAKIVAIMSGDYTLRGEVAIFDKWKRAKSAVKNGVDLVLELPAIFVLNGADVFAKNSIEILKSTGIFENLFFGVEHEDVNYIKTAASFLKSSKLFSEKFDSNLSFNEFARQKIKTVTGIYPESNDMLGILYTGFLPESTNIFPIKRIVSDYNSANNSGYAASPIRQEIISKNIEVHNKNENYYTVVKLKLLSENSNIKLSEANISRIKKAAFIADSYDEFIELAYHKRLTKSKIKRETLKLAIDMNENWQYFYKTTFIRPLAASEDGREIIKQIAKTNDLILNYKNLNKLSKKSRELFYYNEKFTELYHAFYDKIPHTDRTKNVFNNK